MGLRVCAWCPPEKPTVLGFAQVVRAGAQTHGICDACRDRLMDDVRKMPTSSLDEVCPHGRSTRGEQCQDCTAEGKGA